MHMRTPYFDQSVCDHSSVFDTYFIEVLDLQVISFVICRDRYNKSVPSIADSQQLLVVLAFQSSNMLSMPTQNQNHQIPEPQERWTGLGIMAETRCPRLRMHSSNMAILLFHKCWSDWREGCECEGLWRFRKSVGDVDMCKS